MTRTASLLAALAAITVASGSAYAESRPNLPNPIEPSYSASATNSSTALSGLLRDWDRADFTAPSKPGQTFVSGRGGYVTSGPEYHAMVSLIRAAIRESREGHDQDALATIAKARTLLGRMNGESTASPSRMAKLGG